MCNNAIFFGQFRRQHWSTAAAILFVVCPIPWNNNNNITVVVDNISPKHTNAMARTCSGKGEPPKGKAQQERGAPASNFDAQLKDNDLLEFSRNNSKDGHPFGEHGWLAGAESADWILDLLSSHIRCFLV